MRQSRGTNDNYVVSESQAQGAKLCQVGDDDEGLKLEEED
jgi:hypothetical protein